MPEVYACAAAYPPAAKSQRLGRDNLGLFRLHNTRFDVIGGLLYYALVVSVGQVGDLFIVFMTVPVHGCANVAPAPCSACHSTQYPLQRPCVHVYSQVIPRCNVMASVLEAPTLLDSLALFGCSIIDALATIFQDSYLSMLVVAGFFLFAHGFACGGGVGCLSHHAAPPKGKAGIGKEGQRLHPSQVLDCFVCCLCVTTTLLDSTPPVMYTCACVSVHCLHLSVCIPHLTTHKTHSTAQIVRARMGGTPQQLLFAVFHAGTHLLVAVVLLLLLELGIETCIHYQAVGREGYHSLYRWYTAFEQEHFPDPQGLRRRLSQWTLGLYPRCLQWLMAIFDVPESIAVTRGVMCQGGGQVLSRVQVRYLVESCCHIQPLPICNC